MHKTSSTEIFQEYFLGTFHSRKLLLHNPPPESTPRPPPSTVVDIFDSNIALILSVILCGLICSFGLNFLLRCALRFTDSFMYSGSRARSDALPVNSGIKEKALKSFPVVNYSVDMKQKLPAVDPECAICLSDFVSGEILRLLPKCKHGFHVGCIDEWLKSHSSCPKCRQSLIELSLKVVESGGVSSVESSPAVPESNFCILPLGPEGLMCSFRRM